MPEFQTTSITSVHEKYGLLAREAFFLWNDTLNCFSVIYLCCWGSSHSFLWLQKKSQSWIWYRKKKLISNWRRAWDAKATHALLACIHFLLALIENILNQWVLGVAGDSWKLNIMNIICAATDGGNGFSSYQIRIQWFINLELVVLAHINKCTFIPAVLNCYIFWQL